MTGERYTEKFKIAAVKQVTENGYSMADIEKHLGTTIVNSQNQKMEPPKQIYALFDFFHKKPMFYL